MKGDKTPGRRVYPGDDDTFLGPDGSYWLHSNGDWYAHTPTGALANLTKHKVTEHPDGTITVSPSILVTGGGERWHGFLESGSGGRYEAMARSY